MLRIFLAAFVISAQSAGAAEPRLKNLQGSSIDDVRKLAKSKDPEAILELGDRGDSDSKDMLRTLAAKVPKGEVYNHSTVIPGKTIFERGRNQNALRAGTRAKEALAKMGDRDFFQEFLNCSQSDNLHLKLECIQALGYIGNKDAIKVLGPMLSDHRAPASKSAGVKFPPIDQEVAEALNKIMPKMSGEFRKKHGDKFANWKDDWSDWWKEHQDEYK